MPATFRLSMASTAYFHDQLAAQLVVRVLPQAVDAAVDGVDAPLRFTPASGANGATFQGTLPPAEFPQHLVQRFGIVVVDELAVHGQRRYTDIDGAAEVGFSPRRRRAASSS